MPRAPATLAFLSFLAFCAGLHAREGGVLVEFCLPTRECLGDSLEIVFESGTSTYEGPVEVGTEIPVDVVVATETPDIQGFSYAVRQDPERLRLLAESVTTAGTIIDPGDPRSVVSPPYFEITRAVPGGFISAVVFSFMDDRTLPVGERLVIARARYAVASPPGCTLIEFAHGELAVPGSPPVAIDFTAAGRSAVPRLVQGLIDAAPCPELCGDGVDNDGDGMTDCDDDECARRGVCARPEDCTDGFDNDVDGDIDCEDLECRSQPFCPEPCANGVDDDDNGLVDCDDPQCRSHAACREPEDCNDGIDNDGDRRADCDDPDCGERPFCAPVPGADGGVLEDLGGEDVDCAAVSLEVVFANDSSTLRAATPPGSGISLTIVAETRLPAVSGWSYGVRHDPEVLDLDPESVTTRGTVVEPTPEGVAIPPLLDLTRSVPGGFVSAVVLALEGATQLPPKRNRIARAAYVVRSDPSGRLIELVDPEVLEQAEDVSPEIRVLIGGTSRRPCRLRHGRIPPIPDPLWEDCTDGVDNDLDGLADCADRECAAVGLCGGCPTCAPVPIPGPLSAPFRRGDADGNGRLTVRDGVVLILASLQIRAPPYDCSDALDADDDGRVTIADALPVLAWVFQRGERLARPFFACGYDVDCREPSPACR